MAYTSVAPRNLPYEAPAAKKVRGGFFRRLLDALMASRQYQAEREIAAYLAEAGGRFTDESEREIERLFLSNSKRW